MPDPLATQLADRFRADAQALRVRAGVLAARSPQERGGGPDAAACNVMADACDRVTTLFATAAGDDALRSAATELDRLLAAERSPDARHVYAGAVARVRQAIDPSPDEDDDEDDEDDDDDDER